MACGKLGACQRNEQNRTNHSGRPTSSKRKPAIPARKRKSACRENSLLKLVKARWRASKIPPRNGDVSVTSARTSAKPQPGLRERLRRNSLALICSEQITLTDAAFSPRWKECHGPSAANAKAPAAQRRPRPQGHYK